MASIALLVAVVVIIVSLLVVSVRRIGEHEYGVIFRMGRVRGGVEGPGVVLLVPFLDALTRVNMRPQTLNVLVENTSSADGFPVEVEATVHYRVFDPEKSVTEVDDYRVATEEVVRSFLRSLISQNRLDEIGYGIESLNEDLQNTTEMLTGTWGVEILQLEANAVRTAPRMRCGFCGLVCSEGTGERGPRGYEDKQDGIQDSSAFRLLWRRPESTKGSSAHPCTARHGYRSGLR